MVMIVMMMMMMMVMIDDDMLHLSSPRMAPRVSLAPFVTLRPICGVPLAPLTLHLARNKFASWICLNLNLSFWANTFVYESAHSMNILQGSQGLGPILTGKFELKVKGLP